MKAVPLCKIKEFISVLTVYMRNLTKRAFSCTKQDSRRLPEPNSELTEQRGAH